MRALIIPGFVGNITGESLLSLQSQLQIAGINAEIVGWANFPDQMDRYSMTAALESYRKYLGSFIDEEVILIGTSLGGVIATVLASEFKIYKLVLIVTPFQFGVGDDMGTRNQIWKEQGTHNFPSSQYGDVTVPYSFYSDAQNYNALDYIEKVACPLLVIAGTADVNVPFTSSKQIFEKAREPKQWLLVEGMVHKYKTQPEIMQKVDSAIISFIQE